MPRPLTVYSVGDTRSFRRTLHDAGAQTEKFAGRVHFLEGNILHLSEAVVGVGGVDFVARELIEETHLWDAAERQLEAQLMAMGRGMADIAGPFKQLTDKYQKYGFSALDLAEGITYLIRATGNIRSAFNLAAVTANVAAGRHMSFARSSFIIGKFWDGYRNSLSRVGIVLPINSSTQEGLRILNKRFAGQAAAGSTSILAWRAQLANLEKEIGLGILPYIDKAFNALTKWTDSLGRGGKFHDAFESTIEKLKEKFHEIVPYLHDSEGLARDIFLTQTATGRGINSTESETVAITGAQKAVRTFGLVRALEIIGGLYLGVRIFALANRIRDVYKALQKTGRQIMKSAGIYKRSMTRMQLATTGLIGTLLTLVVFIALIAAISYATEQFLNHISTIKHWLEDFARWMPLAFKTAWAGVEEGAKAVVYGLLQWWTAGARALLLVASLIPGLHGPAMRVLNAINAYISRWAPNFDNVNKFGEVKGNEAGTDFLVGVKLKGLLPPNVVKRVARQELTRVRAQQAQQMNVGAGDMSGGIPKQGPYRAYAAKVAARAGVPPRLFIAQINQESGFDPNVTSSAGAIGIAQIMPATARGAGINPHDPYEALAWAAMYMGQLGRKYRNWYDPLSVYNSGRPWSEGQYIGQTHAYVLGILAAAGMSGNNYQYTKPVQGLPTPRTNVTWSGKYQGLNAGFARKLESAVAAAGGTEIHVTSGRRSQAENLRVGGAENSNHLTGHAADGTCRIGRQDYPLGDAPLAYARFGLRAGRTFDWGGGPDIYHVDDALNVGGLTPASKPYGSTTAGGEGVKGSHRKKKKHYPSGDALLPQLIQLQLAKARATTETHADDIRAIDEAEKYLRKELQNHKLAAQKRINIEKELARLEKQKRVAVKKKRTEFQLPLAMQQRDARARTTPSHADDLAIDRAEEKYLREMIASGKLHGKKRVSAERMLVRVLKREAADQKARAKEMQAKIAKDNSQYFAKVTDVSKAMAKQGGHPTFMTSAFSRIQQAMDDQWTQFFNNFDAATQQGIDAINGKYDQLTPTERALQDLQSQHEGIQKAQTWADAEAALNAALISGDPKAITDAQAQINDMLYQQNVDDLTAQADDQRAKQEDARQAALDAYQAQRDVARGYYEDLMSAMDDWLADQQTKLQDGTESWKQFIAQARQLGVEFPWPTSAIGYLDPPWALLKKAAPAKPPHGKKKHKVHKLAAGGIVSSPTFLDRSHVRPLPNRIGAAETHVHYKGTVDLARPGECIRAIVDSI